MKYIIKQIWKHDSKTIWYLKDLIFYNRMNGSWDSWTDATLLNCDTFSLSTARYIKKQIKQYYNSKYFICSLTEEIDMKGRTSKVNKKKNATQNSKIGKNSNQQVKNTKGNIRKKQGR